MGFLSKFEGRMEDTVEGAAERLGGASISPVQIAKKAEKQMKREKVVGAGKQFVPTLYTVLVSPDDDARMFNYYPTLAGETETYLQAKAAELGLAMDGQPLVRFIADDQLKRGKFDVVAELVAAQIVERLRADEMARYGIASPRTARPQRAQQPQPAQRAASTPGAAPAARAAAPRNVQPAPHGAPAGNLVPLQGARAAAPHSMEPAYDPELDEINSANIAEPNWQAAQPAPQPMPQSAYEQHLQSAEPTPPPPERMGRESSNDIVIPDINASRVHAEIRCEPTGAWVITDLGSLNGVFINGRRIKSAPLRDADMIRIGTTELEFQNLEQ